MRSQMQLSQYAFKEKLHVLILKIPFHPMSEIFDVQKDMRIVIQILIHRIWDRRNLMMLAGVLHNSL